MGVPPARPSHRYAKPFLHAIIPTRPHCVAASLRGCVSARLSYQACIDQDNIESSLHCLPVFLSGCQSLLVLHGPSYTSRLWCVMELFVYLQMGGDKERIVVYAFGTEVQSSIAAFDAGKAKCFLDGDRQQLLAVIESGFGDLVPFNQAVRGILAHTVVSGKANFKVEPTPVQDESTPVQAFAD